MIVSKVRSSLRVWLAIALVGSFFVSFAVASDFDPKGFGAQALGAAAASSYTVLTVTTLEDTGNEGSFRWAATRTYPRKVVFAVSGTLHLTSTLDIKTTSNSNRNYLTIDGMSAPDKGICIAGWEVILRDIDQVVIKDVRFRRGRDQLPTFPQYDTTNSTGLDCVSIKGSRNILFDHVSFSWSCDELVGITRSQNITFQWCIFAEPLGQEQKWVLHPYGVDHSAGMNISSSTVSVHHSLLYNFRFRGPQFEANDVNSGMSAADRAVKLESVNNVVFNYRESGGRYSSAIESGTPNDATFHFHFVGNRYFPADNARSAREIVAASSSSPDTSGKLKIYVSGNIGPNSTSSLDPESDIVFAKSGSSLVNILSAGYAYSGQLSSTPLFTHPSGQEIPVYAADDNLVELILANAGCRPETRDDADIRVVSLVQDRDTGSPQISDPAAVGGYPDLLVPDGSSALPAIVIPPSSQNVSPGTPVILTVSAESAAGVTYQWFKDGVPIPGASQATHVLPSVQPEHVGVYCATVTNSAGTVTSRGAIVGVEPPVAFLGSVVLFSPDIQHPNGNIYDQYLLTGAAATITADPGQVSRLSFVDTSDDIVQLEFSGPGSLTVQMQNPSGPAPAAGYNQPSVNYMKGHLRIVITGATENTYLGIYTVGTMTNGNPALYRPNVQYDGFADLQSVAIQSTTNRFGGTFLGSTRLSSKDSFTGLYAPEVRFTGPLNLQTISAAGTATPCLVSGPIDTGLISITGGDMLQSNGKAVQVGEVGAIHMVAGTSSHGAYVPAKANLATYERNGVNVTSQIVQNP